MSHHIKECLTTYRWMAVQKVQFRFTHVCAQNSVHQRFDVTISATMQRLHSYKLYRFSYFTIVICRLPSNNNNHTLNIYYLDPPTHKLLAFSPPHITLNPLSHFPPSTYLHFSCDATLHYVWLVFGIHFTTTRFCAHKRHTDYRNFCFLSSKTVLLVSLPSILYAQWWKVERGLEAWLEHYHMHEDRDPPSPPSLHSLSPSSTLSLHSSNLTYPPYLLALHIVHTQDTP